MIDRINKKVKNFLNTDNRGNYSPTDFNVFIQQSILETYEDYLFELNRLTNRQNRGLVNGGIENLPNRLREKINHFSKSSTLTSANSVFTLPSDCRYIDLIEKNLIHVQIADNVKEFKTITRNRHTRPLSNTPIGLRQGNKITISPDMTEITCHYLREPLLPNWTFRKLGNAEVFDNSLSGFQDVDMHTSEEHSLTIKVLMMFGINLKESDIQQITSGKETEVFREENTL